MARKKKEESSSGGCPAWLATYGDMVTLVLTFFVLLYSMSTVDIEKWKGLVMALNGSPDIFTVIDNPTVSLGNTGLQDPPEIPEDVFTDPTDEWKEFIENLVGAAEDINEGADGESMQIINIEPDDLKVIVRYDSDVFFETASDELRPEFYPAIEQLIDDFIMPGVRDDLLQEIEIQGHADIRPFNPIQAGALRDNWGLSGARAAAVLRHFEDNYPAIPLDMLKMAGYGDTRPVEAGVFGEYDDPNREEIWRQNRRVEFVLWKNVEIIEAPSEDGGDTTNT